MISAERELILRRQHLIQCGGYEHVRNLPARHKLGTVRRPNWRRRRRGSWWRISRPCGPAQNAHHSMSTVRINSRRRGSWTAHFHTAMERRLDLSELPMRHRSIRKRAALMLFPTAKPSSRELTHERQTKRSNEAPLVFISLANSLLDSPTIDLHHADRFARHADRSLSRPLRIEVLKTRFLGSPPPPRLFPRCVPNTFATPPPKSARPEPTPHEDF